MRFTLLILGSLFSVYASAGVYKCTDANGDTEYRSNPCAPGRNNIEINVKTGSSTDLDEQENQQTLEQKKQQAALEQQKLEQQQLLKKQADINREAIDESAKNQSLIKNKPDEFSAYAFPSYTPEKLPDLVRNYQGRLAEIERLRRQAAEKALASGQCIRVESAELNSKSNKDALVFLIDCSSAKKFYFTEQELIK
jgi:MoxR-like ATPase